jgi:hypothetical protein
MKLWHAIGAALVGLPGDAQAVEGAKPAGGLSLASRALALSGGLSGPAIQPGKGAVAFDTDISGLSQLWLLEEDAGSYDRARTLAGWAGEELSASCAWPGRRRCRAAGAFERRRNHFAFIPAASRTGAEPG